MANSASLSHALIYEIIYVSTFCAGATLRNAFMMMKWSYWVVWWLVISFTVLTSPMCF